MNPLQIYQNNGTQMHTLLYLLHTYLPMYKLGEMIMWGGQLFCRNYPAMVITNTRDEREISLAPVQKKRGSHYTSWWSPRLAIICIANRKMMSCIYILAAAEMAPIGKWPLYSSSQSKWLLQSIQIALSSAEQSFLK